MVGKGFIATGKRDIFENFKRNWYHVDAKGQVVGRLATQISKILQGKHKPIFDPSIDCGDNVVITNAKDVVFTRNQWKRKLYTWHTGYPGGFRQMPVKVMLDRTPERILEKAVWGMLPKNKLRRERFLKLKVFPEDHTLPIDITKKFAPLPPHFCQREYIPDINKIPADDPLGHMRGFYVVKTHQGENSFEAVGQYIPTLKEEKKRDKQIERYIKRRPNLIQDIPEFGKYVVDLYNDPIPAPYGMEDVKRVEEEVARDREKGKEPPVEELVVKTKKPLKYFPTWPEMVEEKHEELQRELEKDESSAAPAAAATGGPPQGGNKKGGKK